MQNLAAKEQEKLFNEQKNWLAKRDEFAQSAVVSKGGVLPRDETAASSRPY
jgi:uncharacterized protein YecT (DUF1311 family)